MCLGGLSYDYTDDNNKKTGLHGNVYDFSIDYSPIEIDKIQNIYNYLMKRKQYCINEQKSIFCTILKI